MQTVSFAATLASLILSVLAIFITVISNDSLVRVKDSLNDVPKEVSASVKKSLSQLTKLSSTLESSATKNKEEQEATVKQISELLNQLEMHIEKRLKDHEQKFDDLSKKVDQTGLSSKSMQDEDNTIRPSHDLIDFFVSNTSILALEMIYVSKVYIEQKATRPLSMNELLKIFGFNENKDLGMYLFCVVLMLCSFNLVQYVQAKSGDFDHFIISSLDDYLGNASFEKIKTKLAEENLEGKITDYVKTLVSKEEEEQPKEC